MLSLSTVQPLPLIIKSLYDKNYGIINDLIEVQPDSNTPKLFYYYSQTCNAKELGLYENFRSNGGAAINRYDALAKAIGEGVERYCSSIFHHNNFHLSGYNNADFNCVNPADFALYSDDQYENPGPNFVYQKFTDNTIIFWTSAFELSSFKKKYVPAAMVYCPYYYHPEKGDSPIVQPISTGLACHGTFYKACISGICEVFERDAFTLTWQLKIQAKKILKSTLSSRVKNIISKFETTGAKIHLFYITLDHRIPIILSVYEGCHHDSPSLAFAASATLCKEEAAKKSLEELAHTLRYSQQIKTYMPELENEGPKHSNILDQADHLNFWSNPVNKNHCNWLINQKESINYNEIESFNDLGKTEYKQLMFLNEIIENTGHKVLLKNITTPDIEELGLTVIRAIIPGFQPLFMGHAIRSLNSKRFEKMAKKHNKFQLNKIIENPAPHPYP